MKRKFLEDLGIDKESIDKIMDENSTDIGKAKGDYDDLKAKYDDTGKQLTTANDTIKALKKDNGDNETLQTTIKTHEATIDQLKADHVKELKGIKIDSAITKLLSENSARYPELLAGKFDREKLVVNDDGTVMGLSEQFKSVKETYADMFGKVIAGNSPANPDGKPQTKSTFETLVSNADAMTAEEVAAQFAAMESK